MGFPLAMLLLGSVSVEGEVTKGLTLANYIETYSSPRTYTLLLNSVLYSLGSSLLALTLGTGLAWIVERTNTPGRRAFFALSLVPLIVPGVVSTIAWIFLLSGQIGVINRAAMAVFGLESAPFSIFTLGGMIWAEGLHLSPLVFLVMSAAFKSMDPSLEESALMSGAGTARTLRTVTLPILLPAFASASLIMFVRGLESFEVPRLIGVPGRVPVFTSAIYSELHDYPPDFGGAGALAIGLLLISVVGVWAYQRLTRRAERYATVTGKAFRPRVLDLGRWRYAAAGGLVAYFLVIIGLPFGILLFASVIPFYIPSLEILSRFTLDNYRFVFDHPSIQLAVRNSFLLGATAATVTMGLTAIIAWITTKTRLPGRAGLDFIAFVPIAIPGLVLGVSMILQYLSPAFRVLPIYGTLWILVVAYTTKYLPYGMRTNSAAMLQIHKELEEAGAMSGASWWLMFRRITLPLLRPALVAGWIYIFIVSVRELSASVLLVTSESTVLAVVIFDLFESGKSNAVAALSVMLILTLLVIVAAVQRLTGRFGIKE
ncbi:MAG: hypothetical protein A3H36_01600 [Chloroflexi bacterium RIFCSPLOWO2_02_FULL_71_16]|nr:MAG: hypothetical protein A3H36_01600 [Chloroflexi bacterium RIFCSPLOWO2_02_FULL_71_16]